MEGAPTTQGPATAAQHEIPTYQGDSRGEHSILSVVFIITTGVTHHEQHFIEHFVPPTFQLVIVGEGTTKKREMTRGLGSFEWKATAEATTDS